MGSGDERGWDYVIVGSGAGGGTLAARLVESGMRVFLLEAGGDPCTELAARLPDDYDVPGFHAFACENPSMSWDFEVRHYADEGRQLRDPKYSPARQGVFYPRASALGGCTAHNAMIFVRPPESDWNHIAALTGDRSWAGRSMRRHGKRLENCHYRPLWRTLRYLGIDPTGHGWRGWLSTEKSVPLRALGDEQIAALAVETTKAFLCSLPSRLATVLHRIRGEGDPNFNLGRRSSFEGLCYTPLSTRAHQRVGARERVLQAVRAHPDRLHVEFDALATRVLFDDEGAARGVEYLKGRHLYRAHADAASSAGESRQVQARREVVLCGGAFNTPQLLMLSGIGPATELQQHGIPLRVDLPGVGRNLQDRYEVAVTHRMRQSWQVREGARFERGDAAWKRWTTFRTGLYAGGGAAMALVRRSSRRVLEPDIFCMALPALFEGYTHGFSGLIREQTDRLTWAVLKAHTNNRAGRVTLRSADPRDTPLVNFHYFEEGDDASGADLGAVVDAIRFVRRLTAPLIASGVIEEESAPGHTVASDEALADYVRNTAWGHHASCSCPIGAMADGGVLGSNFAVHGTRRLRVVDASVFPRIPGFFIAAAIYMVGEKAADALLRDAASTRPL
jgi:choline dehydrogenase